TSASFGTFKVTGPTSGTDTIQADFSLTVSQTVPSAGSQTLDSATIKGTVQFNQVTGLKVVFTSALPNATTFVDAPTSGNHSLLFTLGSIEYWINQTTAFVPQTTNSGESTIQGEIAALPEPTFYALTGSGFMGLLLMAIRKRRQTA